MLAIIYIVGHSWPLHHTNSSYFSNSRYDIKSGNWVLATSCEVSGPRSGGAEQGAEQGVRSRDH